MQPQRVERATRAVIEAPTRGGLLRRDTRVIARPGWYQVVTPSSKSAHLNEVVLSSVPEADAERVIDEAIATYHPLGIPVKWCVGPWTEPSDFGARLERRGFVSWEVRGMGCDAALPLAASREVQMHEVVTDADVDEYLGAMMQGWSVPADQHALFRQSIEDERRGESSAAHLWVARIGGRTAGTTGLLMRRDYGYFVGAQVLDWARGAGVYRALLRARLDRLLELGVDLAVTQARESTSAPMLAHLGFTTLLRSRCYLLEPSAR